MTKRPWYTVPVTAPRSRLLPQAVIFAVFGLVFAGSSACKPSGPTITPDFESPSLKGAYDDYMASALAVCEWRVKCGEIELTDGTCEDEVPASPHPDAWYDDDERINACLAAWTAYNRCQPLDAACDSEAILGPQCARARREWERACYDRAWREGT